MPVTKKIVENKKLKKKLKKNFELFFCLPLIVHKKFSPFGPAVRPAIGNIWASLKESDFEGDECM